MLLILEGRVLSSLPAAFRATQPQQIANDQILASRWASLTSTELSQLCVAKIVYSSHSSFANTLLYAPLQSLAQPQGSPILRSVNRWHSVESSGQLLAVPDFLAFFFLP